MTDFVLDASVTLAWIFRDEATPETAALLQSLTETSAVAPQLWPLEVGNILASAERRGRIGAAAVEQAVSFLNALPITIDDQTSEQAFPATLALARSLGLTTYDAAYLELALRKGAPLATLDKRLAQAAMRVNVPLIV